MMAKKKEPQPTLADNLKRAREALGIPQSELARRLGLDVASVSRWERGVHEPDLPMLRRLAEVLGVPLAELVV